MLRGILNDSREAECGCRVCIYPESRADTLFESTYHIFRREQAVIQEKIKINKLEKRPKGSSTPAST